MVPIEQCRKLCPSLKNLSDEEVLKIRENLYEGAQLALESWVKKNSGSKNLEWLLPNVQEGIR
jgi:hypothetical protein